MEGRKEGWKEWKDGREEYQLAGDKVEQTDTHTHTHT